MHSGPQSLFLLSEGARRGMLIPTAAFSSTPVSRGSPGAAAQPACYPTPRPPALPNSRASVFRLPAGADALAGWSAAEVSSYGTRN